MTRRGRRPFVIAVGVFAGALIAYGLIPRDETRIGALLDESCAKLNQTRDPSSLSSLRQFLASALLPQVSLRVTELDWDLQGADAVSARARDLLEGPPLTFALNGVEIKVSERLARVDADLVLTVRGGGEQHRDLRRTRVRLAKHGDQWQIEAVEVEPVAPSEPEARP